MYEIEKIAFEMRDVMRVPFWEKVYVGRGRGRLFAHAGNGTIDVASRLLTEKILQK